MNVSRNLLRNIAELSIVFLASASGSTPASADPPAQSGTSFSDVSHLLAGYEPDLVPVPFGGEGIAGLGWFDYQNDGDLDLFVPNGVGAPNALYRNNGDGTFTDVAAAAGVASTSGYSAVVIGDIDNDGHSDILLSGEGFLIFMAQTPVTLYHNNGDGTFTDITASSGVSGAETAISSVMADFDRDGDLDIFMSAPGHIGFFAAAGVPGILPSESHRNVLYRNNGDLTFTEIGGAAGVDGNDGACSAFAGDYDDDGWMDLFVGNCNGFTGSDARATPINLYRNNGDMTFTDVSVPAGLDQLGFWMGLAPGDYDNDGDVDIFATSTGTFDLGGVAPHALFRNNGDGTYSDVAPALGLALFEFSWGATFTDADNDGFLDLYFLGSLPFAGVTGPGLGNPGRLFMNNQDGTFTEASQADSGGDFTFTNTSGVARGDYDNDGKEDMAINTRSVVLLDPATGDANILGLGQPLLLHNEGNANHGLSLRLVAAGGNPDAVGARVEVRAGKQRQIREVYAGSAFASAESPWLHFGLGGRDEADVKVFWPSGQVEEFDDLHADQLVTVIEGTGDDSDSDSDSDSD